MRESNDGAALAAEQSAAADELAGLWAEIEDRVGFCPSFFRLAGADAHAARALWHVARYAYMQLPANALAKEQLFAYLSRFCAARYCVARHMAFLLRPDADPGVQSPWRMSADALEALLDDTVPDRHRLSAALGELHAAAAPLPDWPAFEMPLGRSFRDAVTVLFLNPARSPEVIEALHRLLGAAGYQRLTLFLGFVRLANFWTETHPTIRFDPDVESLLAEHRALARLVSESPADRRVERRLRRRGELPSVQEINEEVAKLRATEAALAARIAHLDAVTAHAPVMIAELDRALRYRFVNRSYAEFFGAQAAALIGCRVSEVIGEEAYGVVRPRMHAAFAGTPVEFEALVRDASGEPRWLRSSYAPLRDADGEVTGLVAGISDVTQQKREEQARIVSESRLRAAQAASGIGIFDWDIVDDRLTWDKRLRAIWGVHTDEPLDLNTFFAGLHPDDIAATRSAVERALDPGGDGHYVAEYRVTNRRSGRTAWLHASGQVEFVNGRPARMLGAVFDVTARREAEEARALSETRLKLAAEAAGFGTYFENVETGEIDWSPEARAIVGLSPDEPLTGERLLGIIHPDDRKRVHAKVEAHLRGGGPPDFEDEYRCVRPDGGIRWILVKGRRYDETGRQRIAAGTVLDITNRKRSEQRQQLLMNELNHRVKNMLTVVQSLATQTVTSTGYDTGTFPVMFSARLRALAGAHDVLTRGGWEGTTLEAVIEVALLPFCDDQSDQRCVVSGGPEVHLSPNAAVSLSLAFHELATNALKHGALGSPDGRVEVCWNFTPAAAPEFLEISWRERGGPPVTAPSRQGFGTKLIQRALTREFNGSTRVEFAPEGFECHMRLAVSDRIHQGAP
ncbi:MAG TPA: PAS domain S-box protein [Steroidobacteraceae bacterium]|nr:PAS domain S-box protein [Steroidobacteraceae bacterium]